MGAWLTALWRHLRRVLARPWHRFAFGITLAALILLIDRWLFGGSHTLIATGIADETAHASTMVIFLLAFPMITNGPFVAGCLIGSVAIDLDHLPLYLGSNVLTEQTHRPFTHGLLTAGILLAVAVVAGGSWRWIGLGVATGLAAHFLRDMATSTAGVPLVWPVATTGFMLPYPVYAATLAGALVGTVIMSSAGGE